jgi:sec-independent protein translocase protein TatA
VVLDAKSLPEGNITNEITKAKQDCYDSVAQANKVKEDIDEATGPIKRSHIDFEQIIRARYHILN